MELGPSTRKTDRLSFAGRRRSRLTTACLGRFCTVCAGRLLWLRCLVMVSAIFRADCENWVLTCLEGQTERALQTRRPWTGTRCRPYRRRARPTTHVRNYRHDDDWHCHMPTASGRTSSTSRLPEDSQLIFSEQVRTVAEHIVTQIIKCIITGNILLTQRVIHSKRLSSHSA